MVASLRDVTYEVSLERLRLTNTGRENRKRFGCSVQVDEKKKKKLTGMTLFGLLENVEVTERS